MSSTPEQYSHFNSRPHGGRPEMVIWKPDSYRISTHALTEGDRKCPPEHGGSGKFQLTPSRRATESKGASAARPPFQLTPSRRATSESNTKPERLSISTHALTEGDVSVLKVHTVYDISTHALTEGDSGAIAELGSVDISTHALTEGDANRSNIFDI